jgi:flavin-dependent dehydrogenase
VSETLKASTQIPERVDVVILGGGPAGTATALALVEHGADVVLVERSSYEDVRVGETFPPSIQPVLARLNLWKDFLAAGYVPSRGIRCIWGSEQPYEQSFIFNPYGNGWHVDRRAFDASLARTAESRGVCLRYGDRLLACERDSDAGWILHFVSNRTRFKIRARFIVDGTGRASALAGRLGSVRTLQDHLVGIVGFLKARTPDTEPQEYTLIEAAEDGWWYSAPLPNNRLVVAYMTDADLCARDAMRDQSHWNAKLFGARHTQERATAFVPDDDVRVVPAYSSRVDPFYGRGWLAAGDAAITTDPLSGDGVFRAMLQGLRAADAILSEQSGDASAFQRYGRRIDEEFDRYLQSRDAYYDKETRWVESAFWARRHARSQQRGRSRDDAEVSDHTVTAS